MSRELLLTAAELLVSEVRVNRRLEDFRTVRGGYPSRPDEYLAGDTERGPLVRLGDRAKVLADMTDDELAVTVVRFNGRIMTCLAIPQGGDVVQALSAVASQDPQAHAARSLVAGEVFSPWIRDLFERSVERAVKSEEISREEGDAVMSDFAKIAPLHLRLGHLDARARTVFRILDEKNPVGVARELLVRTDDANPFSRRSFERLSGVKLSGLTLPKKEAALFAWAGWEDVRIEAWRRHVVDERAAKEAREAEEKHANEAEHVKERALHRRMANYNGSWLAFFREKVEDGWCLLIPREVKGPKQWLLGKEGETSSYILKTREDMELVSAVLAERTIHESPSLTCRRIAAKGAFASVASSSPQVLARLAADPVPEVRAAVAANVAADAATLEKLMDDSEPDVLCALASNESKLLTTEFKERMLAKHAGHPKVVADIAYWGFRKHETLLPGTLGGLAGHPSAVVRESVAGNAQTPRDAITRLAKDAEETVRFSVMTRGIADLEAQFARDPAPRLRTWLAQYAKTEEALTILADDPDAAVRRRIGVNSISFPAVSAKLSADPDDEVRSSITSAGTAPRSVLFGVAASDKVAWIRQRAGLHLAELKDLSVSESMILARHDSENVRERVVRNSSCSRAALEILVADPSKEIGPVAVDRIGSMPAAVTAAEPEPSVRKVFAFRPSSPSRNAEAGGIKL